METDNLKNLIDELWERRQSEPKTSIKIEDGEEESRLKVIYAAGVIDYLIKSSKENRIREEKIIQATCDWIRKHDYFGKDHAKTVIEVYKNHIREIINCLLNEIKVQGDLRDDNERR